jgi:hypothetical protein
VLYDYSKEKAMQYDINKILKHLNRNLHPNQWFDEDMTDEEYEEDQRLREESDRELDRVLDMAYGRNQNDVPEPELNLPVPPKKKKKKKKSKSYDKFDGMKVEDMELEDMLEFVEDLKMSSEDLEGMGYHVIKVLNDEKNLIQAHNNELASEVNNAKAKVQLEVEKFKVMKDMTSTLHDISFRQYTDLNNRNGRKWNV